MGLASPKPSSTGPHFLLLSSYASHLGERNGKAGETTPDVL